MSSSYLMPVAYFALAFEIMAIILLILPLISPAAWSRVFQTGIQVHHAQSGPLKILRKVGRVPFFTALFFMGIIFYDATRIESESREDLERVSPDSSRENIEHLRANMFRAQRDLYITGFGLFFVFLIYRLVVIISEIAKLDASCTAALKQAQSARRTAQSLLSDDVKSNDVKSLLEKKDLELEQLRKEIEDIRSKSLSLSEDYEKLSDQHRAKDD